MRSFCVSDAEEAVTNVELQQPYDMGSAYNNPKYTNFTTGFAACLDYIFYDKNKLRVEQVRTARIESIKEFDWSIPIAFIFDYVTE